MAAFSSLKEHEGCRFYGIFCLMMLKTAGTQERYRNAPESSMKRKQLIDDLLDKWYNFLQIHKNIIISFCILVSVRFFSDFLRFFTVIIPFC